MSIGTKLGILAELDATVGGGGFDAGSYYVELQVDDTVSAVEANPADGGNLSSEGEESTWHEFTNGGSAPTGYGNPYDMVRVDSGSADTSNTRNSHSYGAGGPFNHARFLRMNGNNHGVFEPDGVTPDTGTYGVTSNAAYRHNNVTWHDSNYSTTAWNYYYSAWQLSPATYTTWTRAEILDPDFQMCFMAATHSNLQPGQHYAIDSWYMDIRPADPSPDNTWADEWGIASNVGRERLGEIPSDAEIQIVAMINDGKLYYGGYKTYHYRSMVSHIYGLVLFTIP